jgi:hypothetical protein
MHASGNQYSGRWFDRGARRGSFNAKAESEIGPTTGDYKMLWTITIVLFILWALGLVTGYTLAGWIHILLVFALIVLIFNLIGGRRTI